MNINLLLTVATLHFIALVAPGPDFVLIMRNTLKYGRRIGFFTGLGFASGIAVHCAYSICGIALLIAKQPAIFVSIKYLGAIYILYMGVSGLIATFAESSTRDNENLSNTSLVSTLQQAYAQGFMTNILNPKATLAILGLYTAVIPANTNLATLLAAAVIMIGLTLIWFTMVAQFFGASRIRERYLRMEKVLNLVFACLFIAAGIHIILG